MAVKLNFARQMQAAGKVMRRYRNTLRELARRKDAARLKENSKRQK